MKFTNKKKAKRIFKKVLKARKECDRIWDVICKAVGGSKPWRNSKWRKHKLHSRYWKYHTKEKNLLRLYDRYEYGPRRFPREKEQVLRFPREGNNQLELFKDKHGKKS